MLLRQRIFVALVAGNILCATLYALDSPKSFNSAGLVFRIGAADGSSAEFSQKEPDVQAPFVIGQSTAGKHWYATQPAVQTADLKKDATHGAASPRVIKFLIGRDPLGTYTLKLPLLFEAKSVPAMRVAIDGKAGIFYPSPRLDPRDGDITSVNYPGYSSAEIVFTFPASYLHRGDNEITLQAVEAGDEPNPGAALRYDAIELDWNGPAAVMPKSSVRIEPTVFFRRQGGGDQEMIDVILRDTLGLHHGGSVTLALGKKTYRQTVENSQDFGDYKAVFAVDDYLPHTTARVEWNRTVHAEEVISPKKKWTVFIVPHVHLDVGFTNSQPAVAEIQARILDEAMDIEEKHPDFRYSTDGEWNLEQFMRSRSDVDKQRLISAVRRHKIFVPAQYVNLLTGFPTAETLIRSLYPSANFSRTYGTPFNYANITDVPSYSWSYASVLAAAGIKDFIAGSNNHRAPVLVQGHLNEQSPFLWEAPDGRKVLFWYSRSYGQVTKLFGISPPLVASGQDTLPLFLQQYERPDYRASAAIVFGSQGENRDLYSAQADLAERWNSKWAYPRLQLSGFYEALETIRQELGDRIPTIRGDGGPYWELGIGSDAYYAAMERQTESRALSAEKLSTLASLLDPRLVGDKGEVDSLWSSMLLMDEHTWGPSDSVSDPNGMQATQQLATKDSFAVRAQELVDDLIYKGMTNISESIATGRNSIVVFNTLNWTRSGLVDFDLKKGSEIVDPSSGNVVPVEVIRPESHLDHVRFVADNVPAFGYKVFSLRSATGAAAPGKPTGSTTLESPYYRVKLDPSSGAVKSIYDKELHRELVNQQSSYRFGQYLYALDMNAAGDRNITWFRGGLDLQVYPARNGRLISTTHTSYGWEAKLESTSTNTPAIHTEIRLFEHEKKIELIEDVEKEPSLAKEAAYFAFPFAISKPKFRYEIQTTSVDPATDMYPGAGHEWFSVQHWVSVQGDDLAATVMPLDVPLVTLGDIDRGRWPDSFGDRPATIFSFAMNNYWEDNYRASQGGKFRFRYVITSSQSFSEGKLSRNGWAEATPLELDRLNSNERSRGGVIPLENTQSSLLDVDDPTLVCETWKAAEDGNGTILRFVDLGGATRPVTIRFPRFHLTSAWRTDAVERNESQLAVDEGGHDLNVVVHPHEIVTLRITIDGPGSTEALVH